MQSCERNVKHMAESQTVLPAAVHPAPLLLEGYVVTRVLMAMTVRI